MENNQEKEIPDIQIEDTVETELDADAEDKPMLERLKREMQCPVCDQIPTSIPIPACPMGHIVCTEYKDKIPMSRSRAAWPWKMEKLCPTYL